MTLTLPTVAASPPPPTIDGTSLLVIGAPKQGKSWLANHWPGCLVFDSQRGHAQLGGLVVPISNVHDLREATRLLIRDPSPYSAVALDTLDDISSWMEDEAVDRCKQKHGKPYDNIGDIPHGAGWYEHRQLMIQMVGAFLALPLTKIFVAHSKNLIDEESGETTKMLDLPGRLGHIVPGLVDSIAIAYRSQEGEYLLSFEGYDVVSDTKKDKKGNVTRQGKLVQHAGSRFAGLQGKRLPASYEAISAAVKGT